MILPKIDNETQVEIDCLSQMAKNGIPFKGPLIADGAIHRFSIDSKKNELDEWYSCHKGMYSHGKGKQTLADLIDRYTTVILPTKPKDARNMKRHLEWWRDKIGKYGVAKISPDLIAQCRQELAEGTTSKKTKRSPATVNLFRVN